MNDLKVTGKQVFMGKEIPIMLGGFGENNKCMADKTIAEIHGMENKHVRERITLNIKRFQENIDIIDLKKGIREAGTSTEIKYIMDLLAELGYSMQQITQAEHIYVLSERGYAKLIKIMETDLAWEIHDKLMDEYFEMREQKDDLNNLSPELRVLINMELEQKKMQQAIETTNQRINHISDVVALSTANWRADAKALIARIALTWGDYGYIKEVNEKIYEQLNSRMSVNLKQRQTNKRDRMAREGVCKSTRDKVTLVDVVADDKKLIEGYMAIVKEMAIKYGVADVVEQEVGI